MGDDTSSSFTSALSDLLDEAHPGRTWPGAGGPIGPKDPGSPEAAVACFWRLTTRHPRTLRAEPMARTRRAISAGRFIGMGRDAGIDWQQIRKELSVVCKVQRFGGSDRHSHA